jgi:hypothetical protein
VRRLAEAEGSAACELTRAGRELRPRVEPTGTWGHRWVGSRLQAEDLDVGLLTWDIRRGVRPDRFPQRRHVGVEFAFADLLAA